MKTAIGIIFALALTLGHELQAGIVLNAFDLSQSNETVVLQWKTASESMNDFFTVEKTSDGINYTTIGTIDGSGTTSLPGEYSFTDEQPASGTNYYRLRQTDFNGSSQVISLKAIEVTLERKAFSIYPNPCAGNRLSIMAPGEGQFKIEILNTAGQTEFVSDYVLKDGEPVTILLPTLNAGFYTVAVIGETTVETQQLIIQ